MRWNIFGLFIVLGVTVAISGSASLSSEIFIFAIAAIGFNVLYGMTGILSFGQCAFFGWAAYLSAMLTSGLPFSAPIISFVGGVIGLFIAVAFASISTRVRGIYLVMLTLVLQQIGYFMALTFKEYTGGENGLTDVVRTDVTFFGRVIFDLKSPEAFMIYSACVLIIIYLLVHRLSHAPMGSVLNALRLNVSRTEVLGYRTKYFVISSFAISGFITGVAGSLYAMLMRFVPLDTVDFETTEKIVMMAIIGGVGTTLGPVVGAAIFLLASDILAPIWPRWLMLMGVLIIFVVIVLKEGIVDVIIRYLNKWKTRKHEILNSQIINNEVVASEIKDTP